LCSWKEIASYLGVSVRTAQGWERERGLPVTRMPGGRSQVRASAAALDAWKSSAVAPAEGNGSGIVVAGPPLPAVGSSSRPRGALLGAVALVVVLLGGAAWLFLARPAVPAAYRLEQNTLVITDARGREMWRKAFANLARSDYENDRSVRFVDLDGDGQTEVLVVGHGQQQAETPLICYAHDGTERWRFVPGRTVRTATETFGPPFHIQNFAVTRVGQQHALRIVVTSQHYLYYPTQVALLAPDGRVLREYWHSGGLANLLVTDLAGDGMNRILLGGVHNATKTATLVVLDPETMSGASVEENPAYQLQGFAPGVEVARLLFPRSCMNKFLEPFLTVGALWREPSEIDIEVLHRLPPNAGASVFYHLSPDLSLKSMTVGSSFERSHAELFVTHVLDHALSATEAAAFRNIRYLSTAVGATK
jgi:excisionase family DNA binding protein